MSILTPYAGILQSDRLGISFDGSFVHCGLVIKNEDGKRNLQDHWVLTLSKGSVTETFDYWTGIGHRKPQKVGDRDRWQVQRALKIIGGMELRQTDENFKNAKTELENGSTAVYPKLDDVLYCLLSDSEACDLDFDEWCAEFGYDTDSRKALAVYEACKANGEKCKRLGIGGAEMREKIADF